MVRRVPAAEEVLATLTIAIDGPAGSGKSTTARLLARTMGLTHIDTGAMYRCVTLAALRAGVALGDESALGALARDIDIRMETDSDGSLRVFLGGEDVSGDIRTTEVTGAVSQVSAHPAVRRAMVRAQRALSRSGGVVLEGRDIGSVVLPWAEVKIYLVADVRVRAERRRLEVLGKGIEKSIEAVEADIRRRDALDSGRATSPLVRPVGAHVVDTSELTIEGQVGRIADIARETAEGLVRLHHPREDGRRPSRRRWIYALACGLINVSTRVLFGRRVLHPYRAPLEEPYIFACNHKAYVDPPFVGATLPHEVHFAAKASLFDARLFGELIRRFNAVPLRRGLFDRDAMERFVHMLREGRSAIIFPEGGRVHGPALGTARPGVGYLALNSGAAVVPLYVSGADRLRECLLRRRRLIIAHGRPIRIPEAVRLAHLQGDERQAYRQFSEMVMAGISALRDEVEGPAD